MSNVGAQKLQHRISQLTDDELWRLVNVDAAQYREEALVIAKKEIAQRGATFQPLIEPEEVTAEEAEPKVYSEEEQIRINEEIWNKTGKPALTFGISLACWVAYIMAISYTQTWLAPVIAFGVCAGLDILRDTISKEHAKTNWRRTLKSAVTIGLLSVGVAIVAQMALLFLRAWWHELTR